MTASVATFPMNIRPRLSNTLRAATYTGPVFKGSGAGVLAGTYPDGLTRLEDVPTSADVNVRVYAPGSVFDGTVVARTTSEVTGEWEITDLPENGLFDVVARKGEEWCVVAPAVTPYVAEKTLAPYTCTDSTVPRPLVEFAHTGKHWSQTAIYPGNTTSSSWAGNTLRQVIPASQLTTGTQLRITFANSFENVPCVISSAYVQKQAGSGDAYDFSTTPVQITVNGGSTSWTVGGAITSDPISLSVSSGDLIVISAYITSGYPNRYSTLTGANGYSRVGNFASTVNAASFSSNVGHVFLIQRIECLVDD